MKKSKFLILPVILSMIITLFLPFSSFALEEPTLTCRNAILVDAQYDEILYEKGAHEKVYPASITKVMTALLVLDAIKSGSLTPSTPVTVSAEAADIPYGSSTANIQAGETLTVEQLLYCLLLPSANEAAQILAETVSGSQSAFVDAMNQKAKELGCEGTHFVNPHGLHDDNHYTTPYDITLYMKATMEYDLFQTIISKPNFEIPATNLSEKRIVRNTNGLVSNFKYLGYLYLDKGIGGKTGTTPEAGHCLVQAAKDDDTYLISVIMGAEEVDRGDGTTDRRQFSETIRLLDWGFDNFHRATLSGGAEPVASVRVTLSTETDQVMVKPQGSISRTLPKEIDIENMEQKIQLFRDEVAAPVEAGQVLGTMTLLYNNEIYGTLDLVADTSVSRSELLYRIDQISSFFQQSGVKVALVAVLAVVVLFLLRIFVFQKKRRYRSNSGGRRGRYSGRRSR